MLVLPSVFLIIMSDFDNYSSSDDETVLDDYKGKNGIVFLIDFRREMSEWDDKHNKSFLRLSFDACRNLMRDLARSGKNDLVGVCLMGTEKGDTDGTPQLTTVQPLGPVTAQRIKDIDELFIKDLEDKYGRNDKSAKFELFKILNSSLKSFLNCRSKIYSRTIVLMTNDDDPFGTDAVAAHQARKRAKKMSCAEVDLVVVGLGDSFRPNQFYNELIALVRNVLDKDWAKVNRVHSLDSIDNHLTALMSRLSRTNRDLIIADEASIPVSLYKLFSEPKVKLVKKVVDRTQEQTVSQSEDTQAGGIQQSEAKHSQFRSEIHSDMIPLVGGKPINITRSELENTHFNNIEVGINVIGFMPTRDIPEYLSVTVPLVMLPNYFSADGIKAFTCLLENCREEQLSMVCWYKYSSKSLPSLVACHPMSLQNDVCPDGFCVSTLPFSDNYSDPEVDKLDVEPSYKQREAARAIVKKLTVNYTVDIFHDYELQKTLAMVEALALDYDSVPPVWDDTVYEDDDINLRISNHSSDFNDCSHLGQYDTVSATKRPSENTSFRASKNPKISSIEGMLRIIREGKAAMLTAAQLKQSLDAHGIIYQSSASKSKLVELVNKRIGSE